jgi:hypothetical protein
MIDQHWRIILPGTNHKFIPSIEGRLINISKWSLNSFYCFHWNKHTHTFLPTNAPHTHMYYLYLSLFLSLSLFLFLSHSVKLIPLKYTLLHTHKLAQYSSVYLLEDSSYTQSILIHTHTNFQPKLRLYTHTHYPLPPLYMLTQPPTHTYYTCTNQPHTHAHLHTHTHTPTHTPTLNHTHSHTFAKHSRQRFYSIGNQTGGGGVRQGRKPFLNLS